MAYFATASKEDLKLVVLELGEVTDELKLADLSSLTLNSNEYETVT